MKALLITIALFSMSQAGASDLKSEVAMKACVTRIYTSAAASETESKELIKAVNDGIKFCRNEVKGIVKAERAAARADKTQARITAQIAKLQLKLNK